MFSLLCSLFENRNAYCYCHVVVAADAGAGVRVHGAWPCARMHVYVYDFMLARLLVCILANLRANGKFPIAKLKRVDN